MFYTVRELAELSGITVRTLHYYDQIGLLKPSYVNEAGYRFYAQQQLVLLQQILFYKELNFDLKQIKEFMTDPNFDLLSSLKNQKNLLLNNRTKIEKLITMVQETITALEKKSILKEQEMFAGFDAEKQRGYENEMVEQYGSDVQEHINKSYQNIKSWNKSDWDRIKMQADNINKELVYLLERQALPDAETVQKIIKDHYNWICLFWQPNATSYAALADLYTTHPDFKKLYAQYHPNLGDYLAAAMKHYAYKNLKD
jgi:DNA-binding transcriptional MerR regulator